MASATNTKENQPQASFVDRMIYIHILVPQHHINTTKAKPNQYYTATQVCADSY